LLEDLLHLLMFVSGKVCSQIYQVRQKNPLKIICCFLSNHLEFQREIYISSL